ncbi:MAG: transporter substrate-binding domain-containing protein [Emcibacteraceae bacterium]|nr:transporter substrate-binding domain-containing protein [Emcibacteraceae bacterium]
MRKDLLKVMMTFFLFLTIQQNVSAQNSILTPEEQAWVADHPVIKSTNELSWAPLDFVRNGVPLGYSVDYLNLVAKNVGIEIEYVNGFTWDILLDKLKNKEIDIAQSIIQSPDRDEYLIFTKPYLNLPMVYFGREGSDRITRIEDLKDKRIGVVKGAIPAFVYKNNYPELNLIEFDTTFPALKALSAGSIDVHADILSVSRYIIRTNMLPGIELIGDKFYPEMENVDKIRLAVRDDWPILISILEKGMNAITEAELGQLSDKWQTVQSATKKIDLSNDERQWLSQHKTIIAAVDPSVAPFEFIDQNGDISGITGAYLEKIGQLLDVEFISANSENWADSLDKIINKDAQIISLVTPLEEWGEMLLFTDAYVNVVHMIFARKGEEVYGNMDGLIGRKISQVEGFAIKNFIERDYPDIEIITAKTVAESLRLVATGEVDAYVGSMPMGTYHIEAQGFTNIVVVGDTQYRGENAFGIRTDLPLLASAFKKALAGISPSERAEISRTWLGLKTVGPTVDYNLVWQILLAASILVMIILIWNNSLRREVDRRIAVERQLLVSQQKAKAAQLEAEAANAAKSNFLANMSHEIRTPLNAIIGFSDAMLTGVGGTVIIQKHKEYLTDIKNSGEHLATVIKDILDLSKIEAGKWRLEESEFNLGDCIFDVIKMLETQVVQKNLNVIFDNKKDVSSLKLIGDFHAIKRIFINLLSNSIKYTPEGGIINCQINRLRNGRVEIEISDNGIGIPKDRIEHVINPFVQIHEEYDLNEDGTGLGLPIVKTLVELHGGKFVLTSEVDVGTKAVISFPTSRVIG